MNDHHRTDDVLIDLWTDGRLEGEDRRAFEARLAAEPDLAARARLQGAIDDSLARVFRPPAVVHPPILSEIEVPLAEVEVARAGSWLAWWPLAGVAAACLALVLYVVDEQGGKEHVPGAPGAPEVAVEQPRGGLVPAPALASDFDTPDLDLMYWEMGSVPGVRDPGDTAVLCSQEELTADDGLSRTLLRRHGQLLALSIELRDLEGPFTSPRWPSASIFRAFPPALGGRPVIIVLESEENYRCCIRTIEPTREDLQAFFWRAGKVRITEITPANEPLYLQGFGALQ